MLSLPCILLPPLLLRRDRVVAPLALRLRRRTHRSLLFLNRLALCALLLLLFMLLLLLRLALCALLLLLLRLWLPLWLGLPLLLRARGTLRALLWFGCRWRWARLPLPRLLRDRLMRRIAVFFATDGTLLFRGARIVIARIGALVDR